MVFEVIKDCIKLALIGVILFFFIHRYVRWRRPDLRPAVEQHRLTIMMVLGLVLMGIKVSEDALTGDSGPMDKEILLWVHQNVPAGLTRFFDAVTITGSFKFFLPLLVVITVLFAAFKKWFEVLLLVCSSCAGGLLIYVLKAVTARDRPALWETRWYWGTSFPSGHTLETACVSMALAVCLGRVWPEGRLQFRVAALVWLGLVGLSRLVLGVHWPTDVMAAACIGLLIPVGVRMILVRSRWPGADQERSKPLQVAARDGES
jgi:undecaprenyl-diphosphatase